MLWALSTVFLFVTTGCTEWIYAEVLRPTCLSTLIGGFTLFPLPHTSPLPRRTSPHLMASPVPQDPNRVYYVAGGFQCSRPILTGDKAKPTFESIPTVDFSRINGSLEERKALAREVGLAASLVGFFYAVNPPVSSATMGELRLRFLSYLVE